jgi:peptide/nickel transport system substrate-binding protein
MGLEEHELRTWVRQVATGQANRRDFIRSMLGLGLAGPLIAEMLATPLPARSQETREVQQTFIPTRRGGGGTLRLLSWVAPTILNPHFAPDIPDHEASRVVYDPLLSVAPNGDFIPILVEEVPSFENGGRARDGTWAIWRLKRGVVWHDGTPFTADDVVFTQEFATDSATGALTRDLFEQIHRIDKLDEHMVKVVYTEPTPLWYLVGRGPILPKHLFAEYKGANARNAPYNLKPVGTGPYKLVDFKPKDVALYDINPHYHVPNRPFFDTVELKGGRPLRWLSIGAPLSSNSTGRPVNPPATTSMPPHSLSRPIPIGSSISTKPHSCWSRRAGNAAATASAPRTAAACRSCTRLSPTLSARRRRPS